jgi:hypothetical protein
MPDLGFVLDDLSAQSERELTDRSLEALSLITTLVMAHARGCAREVVETALARWLHVLAEVVERHGHERLQVILSYLYQTTKARATRVHAVLRDALGDRIEETLMNTAARWRKRERTEGHAEGQVELLLRLLMVRFGPLPQQVQARVRAGTVADRGRWAEAVLDAKTLEDVFGA